MIDADTVRRAVRAMAEHVRSPAVSVGAAHVIHVFGRLCAADPETDVFVLPFAGVTEENLGKMRETLEEAAAIMAAHLGPVLPDFSARVVSRGTQLTMEIDRGTANGRPL